MVPNVSFLKGVRHGHPYVAAILAAACLGLLGFYCLGEKLGTKLTCAILVVSILVLGGLYTRFFAIWLKRVEDLAVWLKNLVEGRDAVGCWKATRFSALLTGSRLRQLLEELAESVKTLRLEKQRTEMVLANMEDGVIVVDANLRICLVNRAVGGIFQAVGSSALGRQLSDVELHPEVVRLADSCIRNKQVAKAEIKLPGWPQRVIGIRATPFRAAGSDSAVIILRDLSEVRRHEQYQREFVSNVGHELKTPLTAVRTTAEALLSGAKNDADLVDRFLNNIIKESDRLSVLIEDLMEIARMDSGVTKIHKTDADVAFIVDRALDVVYPQAARKEIMITTHIEDSLTAYCDELQMVQVVRNLADNAVKYTPEGGRVQITACKVDSGVEISVKDNGIGIPQGEVGRIFERFYRVDKARSRQLGGTGLGLAIVKEIVESHGGNITVHTQLGKGSTFIVTLPDKPQLHEES
jgi:two-component system phosphate regulon sensor histidine kinase PhoR